MRKERLADGLATHKEPEAQVRSGIHVKCVKKAGRMASGIWKEEVRDNGIFFGGWFSGAAERYRPPTPQ
jgi:hypothetical protein